jgi:alpha-ketoglutarate-dependent 2,4-dichlorophenoxyacetate dioxygenase
VVQGDLIVWENRCVLHRATFYDTVRDKCFMQCTTASDDSREPATR